LVSAVSSQGAVSSTAPGIVIYNVGSIVAGGVVSITNVLRTAAPEVVVVGASVGSDATDIDPTNNSTQAVIQTVKTVDARLSAEFAKSGVFRLTLAGQKDLTYSIQYSTNLTRWTVLSTNVIGSDGTATQNDSVTTNYPYRFYRAIRLP
jgi:hypothetical protein